MIYIIFAGYLLLVARYSWGVGMFEPASRPAVVGCSLEVTALGSAIFGAHGRITDAAGHQKKQLGRKALRPNQGSTKLVSHEAASAIA